MGEGAPHYQILVGRGRSRVDELAVMVEAPVEVFADVERLQRLKRRLTRGVESMPGITCRARLVGTKQIQRSEGKAVRVVDTRQTM